MRNKTSDLHILCSDAQTLSHRDSMLSVTYDKVHITCVDSIMSVFSTKRHFS